MYGMWIMFLEGAGDMELDNEGYLDPETDYTVWICGYESGSRTTAVTKATFRTLEPGDPAECTFEITVDPLKATSANVIVTPSDSSVGYYFDLLPKSEYTTDAQNLGDVFTYEFTTPEAVVSTATASVTVSKYYNGDELYAADPTTYANAKNKAYIPTICNHSEDAVHWYIGLFGGDLTSETEYSDATILYNLIDLGGGLKDYESINYIGAWGDLTFFGVAEDANGDFGPVFRLLFPVSKEGASPVSDLIGAAGMGRASRSVYMSSVTRMIASADHMRIATLQLESKALSAAERTTLSTRIDARLKAAAADKTAIAPVMRRTFDMQPTAHRVTLSDKASLR